MEFVGKAKRIDDIDLPKLARRIGVGEDELHAFIDVETHGSGFDEKNRPRILFERHIFWKYLSQAERKKAGNLASPSPGGYGKQSEQYDKLQRAMKINPKAALFACSWGLAQIMGFNHGLAGYPTVEAMIEDFKDDEENHLAAAVTFIINNHLDDNLRAHDWKGFALGYNGRNYRINRYDERLAEAFAKWKRIKDTPYVEVTTEPVVEKPATPVVVVTPTATNTPFKWWWLFPVGIAAAAGGYWYLS